jgi:hypothetical protein
MTSGTIGHCVDCHATQAGDAVSAYGFLQGAGYINGTQSTVAAVFGWMGGIMPPGGSKPNAKATTEVKAWVAAGAAND